MGLSDILRDVRRRDVDTPREVEQVRGQRPAGIVAHPRDPVDRPATRRCRELPAAAAAGKAARPARGPPSRLSIRHRPVIVLNRFLKPETRYARRMARIARWDRPIGGRARPRARLDEHAARRPRRVPARLSQPRPRHARAVALGAAEPRPDRLVRRAQGGRTIVNLRGGREHGSWPLEREACERHGLALVDFVLRSREAPDRDDAARLRARFLDELAYPGPRPLQVGRGPGRPVRGAVPARARGRAGRGGAPAALAALRPFPLRQDRHPRRLPRRVRARRRSARASRFLDWVARTSTTPRRSRAPSRPGFWSTLVADRLIRRE